MYLVIYYVSLVISSYPRVPLLDGCPALPPRQPQGLEVLEGVGGGPVVQQPGGGPGQLGPAPQHAVESSDRTPIVV